MSWYIDRDGRIWPLDDPPRVPWWIEPDIEETQDLVED
ncbi:hypothetical protein HUW46_05187 [Amycolatopsis sp. CA-230715]|nr:hypothetical protein HUW46_05187 [Amycolatopsis sp. CA-230715]